MQQSSVSSPNSAAPAKPRSRYYMQKMREKQIPTGNAIELPAEPTPETQTILPENNEAASVANTLPVVLVTDGPAILPKPKSDKLAEGSYLKIEELNLEGVVEKENLAWMDGNVPDTKPVSGVTSFDEVKNSFLRISPRLRILSLERNIRSSFDPEGNILPPDIVVPLTAGFHHRGADPEKPGYTLDEILTLLQSSSPPQKLWALKTFSAILHKAKHSLYDQCLSGSLLAKMVDEDMILPLRFLLDSTSLPLIAATLMALESLLVNDIDEFVMEEILTVDKDPYFFELYPEVTTDNETPDEREIPDAQLIKEDVVKGFLRTGILRRIEYLLHSWSDSLDPSTIVSIFRITTRFVQHSVEIAQKICTEESSLLDILMSDAMTVKSPLSQMRLLRVLTSVLGSVSSPWAMKIRDVIADPTVRDLITESLNLLIVLSHYGFCPENSRDIEDIFPQLIHSAAPKPDGTLTAWDSACSARVLTFLGQCLALSDTKRPLVTDAMAALIFRNILNGYMTMKNIPHSDQEEKCRRLRSAYLFYAAQYCRQERPDYVRLSAVMVQDICEFLPVILNECSGITSQSSYTKRRVSTLSHADAESLPSYGVVLHGGEALHPVLQHRHTMSLAIHALDLLVVAAPEFRAVSKLSTALAKFLKDIPEYSQEPKDFWMSYAVRVLANAVRLSLRILEVDATAEMDFEVVYRAALHLVPYMAQNQTAELTEFLTRIIFSYPKLKRNNSSVPVEFVQKTFLSFDDSQLQKDAQTTTTIFSDLKPLGLTDSSQAQSLAVPSRDPTVFTSSWMLECFSYVQKWGSAMDKVLPNCLSSCVRGYFFWLTFSIKIIAGNRGKTLRFDEIYAFMADFFSEDGWYREPFVKTALQAILSILCTTSPSSMKPLLMFASKAKVKNKPAIDFYDDLLDDFVASSYGDPVFAQYVLLPTLQHQPSAFRAKFWGPEKQAWSVAALNHHNLCYPVKLHLDPPETSVSLLSQYFLLLMTQNITEKRTPLMYLIAVGHLHHFFHRQQASKLEQKPPTQPQVALMDKLGRFLQANETSILTQHILRYKGPSTNAEAVIELHDNVLQVSKNLPVYPISS